ncbi:MAG: DNA translocase FtsK [Saprospiraceae bacterium]|nr:DNA translocase FtsK [Saprospiraceae bacterium]
MAAKRKRNLKQLSLKIGLNDERIPKLLGIVLLFISFYLFIAFFSYLFTWHIDQDKVLRFSWGVLASNLEMANWLGRLGAIVSNMFFYWGFGLPSFLFIYILSQFGLGLIWRAPLKRYIHRVRSAVLWLVLLSVTLGFLFGGAGFPWGGAFGDAVSQWLLNFVGTLGLIVFILFSIAGIVVWSFNPNFRDMTFQQAIEESRNYMLDWFSGKLPWRQQRQNTNANTNIFKNDRSVKTESPNNASPKALEAGGEEVLKPAQLKFPLDEANKREALKVGEAELEIETPFEEVKSQEKEVPGPASSPVNQVQAAAQENIDHSEPYDPTLELSMYEHPILQLLVDYSDDKLEIDREELEQNKDQIIETLLNYKIEITKIRATIGPTVTLYEIVPAPGVRISRIKNLEDDIALSLAALGIRIIAPIPGKGTIGIEVPNKKKQTVSMKEVLGSPKFKQAKMDLPIALGKTISNEVFVVDLAKMPHLLVAGATGQGKSVGINAVLMSLLYKKHPSQLKLVLIDPKKVELFPYSALENHFLAFLPGQDEPIVTETNKVIHTLNSLCIEMDERYDLLKKGGTRNIREYNEKFVQRRLNPQKGHRFMPFIVLVIDEFADLIMTAGKEIELPIGRLAQLARAVGIHLIIATQRPSVNIITGVIKANFPARIAYKVASKVDSRTILDAGGADQLIGRGDMLLSVGGDMVRLQCAFVDTPEVERVIDFISKQPGYPEPYLLPEFHTDEDMQGVVPLRYSDLDEMFEDAARLIVQNQHGSTSMIQRRLKLGYNRAGRIMDQLEAMGIVGPSEGSKVREVLIYDEMELEKHLGVLRTKM